MSALQAAAQGTVEQMALSLAGGSAVAVIAWFALRLTPRSSSRARFATWFSALASIASLPLFAALGARVFAEKTLSAAPHAWVTIPEVWATYLFVLWAAIVSVGLARIAAGLWHVHRVRESCEEISSGDLPACVRQSLASFSRRAARICVSDDVRVPTAIGFFRPTVVIPRWIFGELPESELNQVVLHELTHLARWDDWTNLAQKTIRALLFFHPAVWWIDRQLSLEREMACDDAVIAATENPHQYARCLTMLAERALGRRGAALAQAAVHRVHQVTARVIRILEPATTRTGAGWAHALTALAALGAGSAVAVSGAAGVIAFQPATAQFAQAPTTSARPAFDNFKVVPAAMHIRTSSARPVTPVRHKVKKAPVAQPRLIASVRPSVPTQDSQDLIGRIIPAKAVIDQPATQPSDFVVLTVFSSDQSDVQFWQMTVYVVAPSKTIATTRKTT